MSDLVKAIQEGKKLRETVFVITKFCDSLSPEDLADAEKVIAAITEEVDDAFLEMTEEERIIFVNKMHMAYLYFNGRANQLLTAEFNEEVSLLNNKSNIAARLKMLCSTHIINTACMQEVNEFEEYLERVYENIADRFAEFFFPEDLEVFPSHYVHKEEEKRYLQPFAYAQKKLEAVIREAEKVSGLMRYVYGDADGNNFKRTVCTRYSKINILSLNERIESISKSHLSEQEKLRQLEQAVLSTYWQVRKDQGRRDSRLANKLERFLKKELHIEERYGWLASVPHDLSVLSETPINLNQIHEANASDFQSRLRKLEICFNPSHLKTKKHAVINDIMQEMAKLTKSRIKDEEKVDKMELFLTRKYFYVQENMASFNLRFFRRQSNLADALKKFMREEFARNTKGMENLVKRNEAELFEEGEKLSSF